MSSILAYETLTHASPPGRLKVQRSYVGVPDPEDTGAARRGAARGTAGVTTHMLVPGRKGATRVGIPRVRRKWTARFAQPRFPALCSVAARLDSTRLDSTLGSASGSSGVVAAALIGRPHPSPTSPCPSRRIVVGGNAGTAVVVAAAWRGVAHEFWLQLQPDVSRSSRMTSQ